MPKEVMIKLRLVPGQSWKSRYLSTSDVTWVLKGTDGKEQKKTLSVGLELVASQKVGELSNGVARIEVEESSVRILREGKFVDAPFRQFDPPSRYSFTIDTRSGAADFSGMEKAYAGWMSRVKEGPAGEILGKAFRVDSYVAQLKELYGKPFTRMSGKTLKKGASSAVVKEVLLPFLGPGIGVGPVPVDTSLGYEGMEIGKETGGHYLKASGKYAGGKELTADELAAQLAEFGAAAPAEFRSTANLAGEFTSSVDLMAGREIFSASGFRYSTSASFGGTAVTQEIAGKSVLEPAE